MTNEQLIEQIALGIEQRAKLFASQSGMIDTQTVAQELYNLASFSREIGRLFKDS